MRYNFKCISKKIATSHSKESAEFLTVKCSCPSKSLEAEVEHPKSMPVKSGKANDISEKILLSPVKVYTYIILILAVKWDYFRNHIILITFSFRTY